MNARIAAAIDAAADQVAAGGLVVLIDDHDAGLLVGDAARITAHDVVFMLDSGGGIVSMALSAARCEALDLEPQRGRDGETSGHGMVVSIDARDGTTTGISAEERANTVRVAARPDCDPEELVRPGHIVPVRAHQNGVLGRRGQAEAALDLVRMANGGESAVTCAILDERGGVAGPAAARGLASRHGLPVVTVTEVASARCMRERPLRSQSRERLITHHGDLSAVSFRDRYSGADQLALVRGSVEGRENVPVLLHRASGSADLLAALARDRTEPLALALKRFARIGAGVLIYLEERDPEDPAALDLAAQVLGELGPGSVRPVEATAEVERGLADRGIALAAASGSSPGADISPGVEMAV